MEPGGPSSARFMLLLIELPSCKLRGGCNKNLVADAPASQLKSSECRGGFGLLFDHLVSATYTFGRVKTASLG